MNPKVTIIIINWNGWHDTIECLESLYQIKYPNFDVILVDNNSEDKSLIKINEYCKGKIKVESKFFKYNSKNKPIEIFEYLNKPKDLKSNDKIPILNLNKKLVLIKNDKNYGFAEGNNIGIRYALNALNSDYVLLLNNDTVVDTYFLDELIKVAESDKNIGFTSPKTYYYDFDDKQDVINFAGGTLNMFKGRSQSIGVNEVDKGQYDEIKTVEYVEGSCLLAKKEVLEKVGLFDTRYFAYWEEADLCTRGYKAGYTSVYVPKAKIWHKVSASTDDPTKIYYYTRNKFWFMQKYANKSEYITFLLFFFGFHFWNLVCRYSIYGLYKGSMDHSTYFLMGIKNGLFAK